jgi:uncharacterized protein (TIGR03545 family)
MSLVRLPGLIGFVAVLVIIGLIWFVVLDSVIERIIERTGTAMVGAKVELDSADLSLAPLGLTLTRVQVTDPDAPMTNAVEVARIAFTMDPLNLLRRKVIIDEMTLGGVRFQTPRKRSGAIRQKPAEPRAEKHAEAISLPSLSVPSPEDVLKNEQLQSVKLVEAMKTDVEADKQRWQKKIAELPDKAKFEQYKGEIESLRKSKGVAGILGGAQKAVELQRNVSSDLQQIRTLKTEVEQSTNQWRARIEEATKAPLEDAKRLKDKYGLSGQGATNFTRLLFGAKLADIVESLVRWEARLRPIVQRIAAQREAAKGPDVIKPIRASGLDVRFKEEFPLPDFLVRKAHASLVLQAGELSGVVRNITPDQPVLGMPLIFDFSGEGLKDVRSVSLTGSLNRVQPATPTDVVSLSARDYGLRSVDLAKSGDWTFQLQQARMDADVHLTHKDEAIDGTLGGGFRDVKLKADAPASQVATAVAGTLGDIRAFRVNAEVTGTLADYTMKLNSDLDRVIGEAITRQLGAQLTRFESDLQAAITQKVNAQLQELKGSVGGLDALTKELVGRLNIGEELLKGIKAPVPGLKLPF